jgi:hypothetical protein
VATTTIFTLIKTVPFAAALAGEAFGLAQLIISLPIAAVTGQPLSPGIGARVIVDPTDLIALPAVALALWIGGDRVSQAQGRRAEELRPA